MASRVLVAGWFSFVDGEATAGDIDAAATASAWLTAAGVDHVVAWSPALAPAAGGPTLDEVDPAAFTDLLFVCGPAAGPQVDRLCARFSGCRRIALGVSDPGGRAATNFDLVLARDGDGLPRADLSFATPGAAAWPLVVMIRANPQPEYAERGRHDQVHAALDGLLAAHPVSVVDADTRVDPRVPRQRSGAQLAGLLARADAVVTTRLHGLVFALRAGTPAVAVDPIAGGAKVCAQATALGWPAVLHGGELDEDRFAQSLRFCLSPAAGGALAASRRRAAADLEAQRAALGAALAAP